MKVIYLLTNLLNILGVVVFILCVSNKKISLKKKIILYCILYGADAFVYFSFTGSYVYSILNFLLYATSIFVLTRKVATSIMYTAVAIGMIGVLEAIVGYGLAYANNIQIEQLLGDKVLYAVAMLTTRILQLVVIMVFKNIKSRSKRYLLSWHMIAMTFVLLGSIVIVDILVNYSIKYTISDEGYEVFIASAILFIMDIAVYFLFEQQEKAYIIKEENNRLLDYVDQQKTAYMYEKKLYEREAVFRHDMKNYVLLIRSLAKKGESEKILDAINDKYQEMGISENYIETGNEYIDIILLNKLAYAEEKNVMLKVDNQMKDKLSMKGEDIIVILGNLLDNAIEGAEGCENAYVKMRIKSGKGKVSFILENNVKKDVKIEEDNFIESSKSGYGHGIGLGSVKKLVEKYEGSMELTCKDKKFEARVFLWL